MDGNEPQYQLDRDYETLMADPVLRHRKIGGVSAYQLWYLGMLGRLAGFADHLPAIPKTDTANPTQP